MRPARGWARGRQYSEPRTQTVRLSQNSQQYRQYSHSPGEMSQRDHYNRSNAYSQRGKEQSSRWNQNYDAEYGMFADNDDRRDFISRVYLILSVAIGFCALLVFLTSYYEESREFLNDYWWLYIVFMIGFMIIYIAFACVKSLRRKSPINWILFILMVILLAASTSVFSSLYSLKVISFAFITTASITVLITIIARFIPVDFTKCGTLLCILSIVFLVISIVVTILIIVLRMPILHVGLAGLGVLLISFWMLFDTQRILGGQYELEEDEYLMGAITLFVDIVYIFQYLLIIFGLCASDE